MRLRNLIRTIDAVRPGSGLLYPGVDGERSSGADARHHEHLPAAGDHLGNEVEELGTGQMEVLRAADTEPVCDIEIRYRLFSMGIKRILREARCHCSG